MSIEATEENLVSLFRGLGADERRVLVAIAERVEWSRQWCPRGPNGAFLNLNPYVRIEVVSALRPGAVMILAATEQNLVSVWRALPDAERCFVFAVARRLDDGQRAYGLLDIANDPRPWPEEKAAENYDALVYDTIATLRGKP